jgi:hypothetical protein
MVALGSKESAMTDTERRELTAAELDLVAGGVNLQECMISGFMARRNGESTPRSVTMEDILVTSV